MSKINGKWKFNDAPLTFASSVKFDQYANFTFELTGGSIGVATCDKIHIETNSVQFNVASTNPENAVTYGGYYVYTRGNWIVDPLGEGLRTITFTGEQEVSDEFYEWFTANATLLEMPIEEKETSVAVFYNDSVIATLSPGQFAILKCKGSMMTDDLRIGYVSDSVIPNGER